MAETLTRLTHKIAIQLHLVAESCTIFSSRSRPVRKLLDTPSYVRVFICSAVLRSPAKMSKRIHSFNKGTGHTAWSVTRTATFACFTYNERTDYK